MDEDGKVSKEDGEASDSKSAMLGWTPPYGGGRALTMEERFHILYNEHTRAPNYAVGHYVNYLRRHVDGKTPPSGGRESRHSSEAISPLSYLLRKLKLDLKMAYDSFVSEFLRAPYRGLGLLLVLLKQMQSSSNGKHAVSSGTTKLEEYKRNQADEHDCLLCIKYSLRLQAGLAFLVEDPSGLDTVASTIIASNSKARVTALEILTLVVSASGGFNKVLETFTCLRLRLGEAVRFRHLLAMLNTQGSPNVNFQVACMKFINTLLNSASSANIRVYLQEEFIMAGMDVTALEKNASGDGLEFDDLKREVEEWCARFINVDALLRRLKMEWRGSSTPRDRGDGFGRLGSFQVYPPPSPLALLPGQKGKTASVEGWRGHMHPGRQMLLHSSSEPHLNPPLPFRPPPLTSHPHSHPPPAYSPTAIVTRNPLYKADSSDECTAGLSDLEYSPQELVTFVTNYNIHHLRKPAVESLISLFNTHAQKAKENPLSRDEKVQVALELSSIARVETRLKLMLFLCQADRVLRDLTQKCNAVTESCRRVLESNKIRALPRIYQFSVPSQIEESEQQPLGMLTDLMSREDRRKVIGHMIREVEQRYPQWSDWPVELPPPLGTKVSLTSLRKSQDVLQEGVQLLQSERTAEPGMAVLEDAWRRLPGQIGGREHMLIEASALYRAVCQLFGEDHCSLEPGEFFCMLDSFAHEFQVVAASQVTERQQHWVPAPWAAHLSFPSHGTPSDVFDPSSGLVFKHEQPRPHARPSPYEDNWLLYTSSPLPLSASRRGSWHDLPAHDGQQPRAPAREQPHSRSGSNQSDQIDSGVVVHDDDVGERHDVRNMTSDRTMAVIGYGSGSRHSMERSKSVPDVARIRGDNANPGVRSPYDVSKANMQNSEVNRDGFDINAKRNAANAASSPNGKSAHLLQNAMDSRHGPAIHITPDVHASRRTEDSTGPMEMREVKGSQDSAFGDARDDSTRAESPDPDYSTTVHSPNGTIRSYSAELSEILRDFDHTLRAHDDRRTDAASDITHLSGSIAFV